MQLRWQMVEQEAPAPVDGGRGDHVVVVQHQAHRAAVGEARSNAFSTASGCASIGGGCGDWSSARAVVPTSRREHIQRGDHIAPEPQRVIIRASSDTQAKRHAALPAGGRAPRAEQRGLAETGRGGRSASAYPAGRPAARSNSRGRATRLGRAGGIYSLVASRWGDRAAAGAGRLPGRERRKVGRKIGADELEDLLGTAEIFELVRAQVTERERRRQRDRATRFRGGVREQDLAAVAQREHAGDAVERRAEVVAIAQLGHPGVERHAHAQRAGHAPGFCVERALGGERRRPAHPVRARRPHGRHRQPS